MVYFLATCFLIGLSASAAVGPIFILTFNRSATYGFFNGFATALGAALVDGIFFMLGLEGALPLIASSKMVIMAMDLVGGLILIIVGLRTLRNRFVLISPDGLDQESLFTSVLRSFFMTLLNPAVILFFMVVSINVFQDEYLTLTQSISGSVLVTLGSLTMLTLVAFLARWLGHAISANKLKWLSYASGFLFVLTGGYFLYDFLMKCFWR